MDDSPFIFGRAEVWVGVDLGRAEALALDDDGEVTGFAFVGHADGLTCDIEEGAVPRINLGGEED